MLAPTGSKASFFVPMGPARLGQVALRWLSHPICAVQMVVALRHLGLSPGSLIRKSEFRQGHLGSSACEIFRSLQAAGHEIGCLGWDCYGWRNRVPSSRWADSFALHDQEQALSAFSTLLNNRPPVATASPGFVCTEESLRQKEGHGLKYGSDSRGSDPFMPVLVGRAWKPPQVPVTLPTLLELAVYEKTSLRDSYNKIHKLIDEQPWPVFHLNAEFAEERNLDLLGEFLSSLKDSGIAVVSLGTLLDNRLATGRPLPRCTLSYGAVEGGCGEVTLQMLEV